MTGKNLVESLLRSFGLSEHISPDQARYLNACSDGRYRNVFLSTREGFFRWVVSDTRPGDQICVILGCDAPMVLRATGLGTYEVVGSAFLHGFQYAEGLLGAVPDGFDHVWAYIEAI